MVEISAEKAYMGGSRAKMWTYLIGGVALVLAIVVINFAVVNPEMASNGVETFLSLPGWAFPLVLAALGTGLYIMGLKIETDWPELVGALMISGAVLWGEIMIGLSTFAFGGIWVIPYIVPCVIFLFLMGYSMVKSK